MGFVWSALGKDLRRYRRDPWSLLMWAGVPLLVGALITAVMGGVGGRPKPTAHLLVADEDQSIISNALVGAFGSGPLQEMVRLEKVAAAAGRAKMEAGEATALLIIPAGFGQAALREEESRLYLLTNPVAADPADDGGADARRNARSGLLRAPPLWPRAGKDHQSS